MDKKTSREIAKLVGTEIKALVRLLPGSASILHRFEEAEKKLENHPRQRHLDLVQLSEHRDPADAARILRETAKNLEAIAREVDLVAGVQSTAPVVPALPRTPEEIVQFIRDASEGHADFIIDVQSQLENVPGAYVGFVTGDLQSVFDDDPEGLPEIVGDELAAKLHGGILRAQREYACSSAFSAKDDVVARHVREILESEAENPMDPS